MSVAIKHLKMKYKILKLVKFVVMKFSIRTYLSGSLFLVLFASSYYSCKSDTTNKPNAAPEVVAQIPKIDKLDRQIAENPDDPTLYFNRAQVYYKNEGYDEAIQDMAFAMQLDSANIEYHHFLTDIYLKYPKSYQALLTMQRVVALHPQDVPSLQKLSHLHIILQQPQESMNTLDQALKVDPQNASTYFLRGLTLEEMGKEEEAIKAYRFSTELDADMIDAWIILGQKYQEREDPTAIQFFENAVRVDTTNIFALHTKANYLQQIGATQKAIDVYRKIILLDPGYSDAHFNTGLAYLELDSTSLAYRSFDFVVKTDPTNAQAYYYRGLTGELIGKLAEAKRDFEQTLNMDPGFQPAQESLKRISQILKQE